MKPADRWALLADAVAVVVFVLVGRASHREDDAVLGLLRTLWPFVVGLAVGWFVLLRRERDGGLTATRVPAGVVTGAYAAVVGLALRALTGQGVATSFLVVAVIVLVVLMAGWRAVWLLVRRGFFGRRRADLP